MDDTRKYRRKQKKRRLLLKTILATALIAILAVGTGAWYIVNQLNDTASSAYQGLNRGEMSELRVEPVDIGKDNFSMLILGSDFREGDSGGERTDTMLVATFNKGDRSIKLTSIPRDTYTEIIGYTEGPFYDKINHANAFGGIDMAIDTVENLLDIPIDHYALARFDGLVDIIDALEGIDIDVTYEFDFKEKSRNVDFTFTKGPTHMDGEKALAYARERKSAESGGDKGRGIRQQQVIEAIIDRAASLSSITRFNDLFDAVGNNLQMDLTFGNIVSLHGYASSIDTIETLQVHTNGQMRPDIYGNNIWYEDAVEEDLYALQQTLREHLELPSDTENELYTQ
ncbi:LCP family protein [Shouchella lehensis]|uniref:LytR family transcriptional regulator n=1 Tax=Shouchella lehensis TaxID=300825 RepID=A0A4Y7WS89_9BACI|nr:LCP family protein [Shouchella lehensis]MBG9783670.1 hypothetical protein [Shouchella lehensis]TES51382.1 LytR family transcriptional regulator [Shouchella lehensis]